jgi:putative cardiolipin synthase
VEVTVLTNGLASSNHSSSHSDYMPVRKPLLKQGVELYERRANLNEPADNKLPKGAPATTLHAKAFAVDGKSVFIGSFNWNQRSVNRDTELGVIIHSPQLANEMVERVRRALPGHSFRVSLNESNDLRWTVLENGREVDVKKESQTGFWERFSAGFMGILPIRSQF